MSQESQKIISDVLNINPEQSRLETLGGELEEYAKAMAPGKPVTTAEGAAWQRRLYNTIVNILKTEGQEFYAQYGLLLSFAHAQRDGCFRNPLPYRFAESIPMSAKDRLNFQRMLRLIMLTANPATRMINLKQASLPILLKNLPGAYAERVYAFYQA